MKANELRIGNLVYYLNGNGNFYQWDITVIEDGITDDFEPIPLTEEWLEKFGFEKRDLYALDRWVYNDFEIENMGKYFAKVIWSESCPHTTQFIGHHQYVHQLQNLYFALTGEELTIR